MAALQRRPGALAACLCWLLCLPSLRAATVRFADGGARSMVGGYELSLLLQLAAAHPQAADSLRHIDVCAGGLGWYFGAGERCRCSFVLACCAVWDVPPGGLDPVLTRLTPLHLLALLLQEH